jgi:hypothetical protein
MEYYHANVKYNISDKRPELPVCIVAWGVNLVAQSSYQAFLHSVERMNYTNYKLVWVDDSSEDFAAYHVYQYLNKTTMKLKHKITLVRNSQRIGFLGSLHMHTSRYCGKSDIVVVCAGDGTLLGTQNFQILNKVYQNP